MSGPVPSLILDGPDEQGLLYALGRDGSRRPLFASIIQRTKPNLQMFRFLQGGQRHPLGQASISSLSGTITLDIHGQEIKIHDSWEGMQYSKYFKSPVGELRWRPTKNANGMELWDQQGVMLARYTYLKFSGDPKLEVFVQLDDFLLDLVVMAAVVTYVDDRKGLRTVSKLVKLF